MNAGTLREEEKGAKSLLLCQGEEMPEEQNYQKEGESCCCEGYRLVKERALPSWSATVHVKESAGACHCREEPGKTLGV